MRLAPFSTESMTESARGERPSLSRILATPMFPVMVMGASVSIGDTPIATNIPVPFSVSKPSSPSLTVAKTSPSMITPSFPSARR